MRHFQGKWNLAALAAALACVSGPVFAASPMPVYTLKGITVTATRNAEDLQSAPAAVHVITKQQIQQKNIQSAAQAVSMATGVSTTGSEEGTVNLRGYSTRNILIMVDGQPMNTAWNGDVDWNMIPVENIRRVEVVSGGQSALYGGRAVGGVINIMTDSPRQEGIHGSATVSYGTHATVKQSYHLDAKKGKFSFGTFYESRMTNGWRDYFTSASSYATSGGNVIDSSMRDAEGRQIMGDRGKKYVLNENFGFQAGWDFNKDQKLTYRYVHSNYLWRYKDPHSYVRRNGVTQWPGIDFDDSGYTSFYGTRGWRASNFHSLTYNDQKNGIHAHFGMTDYYKDGYTKPKPARSSLDSSFNGPGSKTSYPSRTWDLDFNKRWNLGDHSLLAGASYGQDKFNERFYEVTDWKHWNSSQSLTQRLGGKDRNWALYVQDKWAFAPKWTAYIGGRYDHYEKYDGYSIEAGASDHYGSASFGQFSPKLSFDYALNKDTNLYISYGKSFTPPILSQVYRYSESGSGIYMPNPDLKPEKTDNWELGMKKKISGNTDLTMDVFYARTKDYIDRKAIGIDHRRSRDRTIYDYQNVGNAKTHGFELALNHRFSQYWSAYLNYT